MTHPNAVICAGRLYCDLVFTGLDATPAGGREVFAEALDMRAGGGAFITAAYLSQQGIAARLVATLPAAPFDQFVETEINAAGIGMLCSAPHPADAPQITVAYPQDGDRAFLTRRVGAAIPNLTKLPKAKHLHIGELTTALEHPKLIAQARAAGMTISLDCAWDGAAFSRRDVGDVIARVDLFFPNAAEYAELTRHGVVAAPRRATVMKLGASGSEYHAKNGAVFAAPAQPTKVRDLTGAGDAFNAGFLSAWLTGADPEAALANGNRMGALAVSQIGGFNPSAAREKSGQLAAARS
ncbi:MAG: PfkB family carbohydrate kinase [Pseudomonadota bacterium]